MNQQDVEDIKVCAFEGGINYWANIKKGPKAQRDAKLNYVGTWLVREIEEADGSLIKEHSLTDAKLRKGIEKAAEHFGLSVRAFVENCDATYADVAVQFALLGEIVYG